MKKLFLLFIAVLSYVTTYAYEVDYKPSDSIRVIKLLNDAKKQPESTNYIIYFARKLKGIPYVAHTLEINKKKKLVINLRQLDCTTYVENVVALSMCMSEKKYTFKSFSDNLKKIRYRDESQPHYTQRLHYFTDWIENNTKKGICKEIQSPTPPFTNTQKINVFYMSENPSKYKMLKENPKYIPTIRKTEQNINQKTYKYIPKTEVKNTNTVRRTIQDGDIIATTTSLKGLDIQHIGFAIWHKDGLHMLNASSLHHKVVEEPMTLYNYLQKQKTMTGIRIIRLNMK